MNNPKKNANQSGWSTSDVIVVGALSIPLLIPIAGFVILATEVTQPKPEAIQPKPEIVQKAEGQENQEKQRLRDNQNAVDTLIWRPAVRSLLSTPSALRR